MPSGVDDEEITAKLREMTLQERIRVLVKVLERIHWQRTENKGREARSHAEKAKARRLAKKKECLQLPTRVP